MKYKLTPLVGLSLLQAAPLNAALTAYEPFDYTGGISNGDPTTATGFSGNWDIGQGSLSSSSDLTYTDLPTSGGSATGAGATRALESLTSSVASGTVYTSLLYQGGGNSGGVTVGAILSGSTSSLFIGFGAGFTGTETGFGLASIDTGNTFAFATGYENAANINNTAIHFLVLELNLDTNTTSLWIDPTVSDVAAGTPGTADLVTSSFDIGSLTGIGYNTDGVNPTIDELRIGTSFVDVSGIPEPSSTALAGLGALALLRRRRSAMK